MLPSQSDLWGGEADLRGDNEAHAQEHLAGRDFHLSAPLTAQQA